MVGKRTSTDFSAARSWSGGREVRAATAVFRNLGWFSTCAGAVSYSRARRTTWQSRHRHNGMATLGS